MDHVTPLPHLKAAESTLALAVAGFVPDLGLNHLSVQAGARTAGFNDAEVDLIAPNGAADIAALLWRKADDALDSEAVREALDGMRVRDRIGFLLNSWLDAMTADEKVTHRLIGFLMLPLHLGLYRRLLWSSADKVWRLAGDKALDENHYSKRTIACGIMATALMTRLTRGRDAQVEQVARNIDGVMTFEKLKAKLPSSPESAITQLAEKLGKLRYGHEEPAA